MESRTQECSTALVTTCPVLPKRASAPQTAVFARLGSRRGEHDLAGRAPKNAATCSRASSSATRRRAPFGVEPSGVGVMIPEVGEHRVERARSERRGRCVIEIRGRTAGQLSTRVTQLSSPCGRLCSMIGSVSP